MKRILMPGTGPDGRVFVTVEITEKDDQAGLSIQAVEGPMRNGDARGSCGQARDALDRITILEDGWTTEMVEQLSEVWDRWHLNDMRPGCEHQRAARWDERPIDPTQPTDTYGKWVGDHSTWNMLAWVRPDEHPDGLLTKACEVCGYKYGTAWLHEPLPDEVIEFLVNLPPSTHKHPWGDDA